MQAAGPDVLGFGRATNVCVIEAARKALHGLKGFVSFHAVRHGVSSNLAALIAGGLVPHSIKGSQFAGHGGEHTRYVADN